ncbi:hypothetical protein V6N13_019742 [Hibiscus sabdariffa]
MWISCANGGAYDKRAIMTNSNRELRVLLFLRGGPFFRAPPLPGRVAQRIKNGLEARWLRAPNWAVECEIYPLLRVGLVKVIGDVVAQAPTGVASSLLSDGIFESSTFWVSTMGLNYLLSSGWMGFQGLRLKVHRLQ